MLNIYKLFVVLAALLSLTAARPSILAPVIVPAAVSHQSVTQIHAHHPVLVATPIVTAIHPIVTHPIIHHPEHIVIG
ncbi:uncharacterized protein LOC129240989 [Anastrepha obliqua]|uniref:uncharacterized protein LOC129240989 n=1 Tax=Anastrepha obliqua TaxID=95512 RepID=UPI00240A478E|nr:uncharacterized protein LOC129240989 [Anastrepha obliqua]